MRFARRAGAVSLAVSAAGALMAVAAPPAAASVTTSAAATTTAAAPYRAAADCPYPYVCIFKDGKRIGQFQDVTSSWQTLPSRPSSPNLSVVNTRNDDTAYVRWSTGSTACIPPNDSISVTGTLTHIRIDSSATC